MRKNWMNTWACDAVLDRVACYSAWHQCVPAKVGIATAGMQDGLPFAKGTKKRLYPWPGFFTCIQLLLHGYAIQCHSNPFHPELKVKKKHTQAMTLFTAENMLSRQGRAPLRPHFYAMVMSTNLPPLNILTSCTNWQHCEPEHSSFSRLIIQAK